MPSQYLHIEHKCHKVTVHPNVDSCRLFVGEHFSQCMCMLRREDRRLTPRCTTPGWTPEQSQSLQQEPRALKGQVEMLWTCASQHLEDTYCNLLDSDLMK